MGNRDLCVKTRLAGPPYGRRPACYRPSNHPQIKRPGRGLRTLCPSRLLTPDTPRLVYQLVAANLAVQRRSLDTQDTGRSALVPADVVQRGENVFLLHVRKRANLEAVAFSGGFTRVARGDRLDNNRSLLSIYSPLQRTTARSTTFFNSRTFPGHRYPVSISIAPG